MTKYRGFAVATVVLVVALLIMTACQPAASSNQPYKIGMTAALTGPAAGTAFPEAEGFRLYMQKVNDSGGINGHKVQLTIQDDRGDPTQAASNMRKFEDDGVQIVRNTSTSATFPPTVQEAKKANIPVVFTLTAPPEAMPPNSDPLLYLASHDIGTRSIWVYLDIMKDLSPAPKVGLLGLQIPASSVQMQDMDKEAQRMGIPSILKIIPADTVDVTSVAQTFQDFGANWIFYSGPGAFSGLLFDALQKSGWKGNLLDQAASVPFETTEQKYKGNPNVYVGSPYASLTENLPPQQDLKAAAQKYGATSINSLYQIGWEDGIVFSQILKQAGWPATTDKLVKVMQNLTVDRSPVMGPLKWTPQDHVGNYYVRIYKFNGNNLAATGPWYVTDSLGQNRRTVTDLKNIK